MSSIGTPGPEGWRLSPGRHRNLLEPKVERMGIAVSTRYVTFFACRRPEVDFTPDG